MTTKIGSPSRVTDPKQEQINRNLYQGLLNLITQVNALPAVSGVVASDSIWNSVGDLAVGDGANSASILSVGTDGDVLTADSGEPLGVKWSTPASSSGVSFSQVMAMISLGV